MKFVFIALLITTVAVAIGHTERKNGAHMINTDHQFGIRPRPVLHPKVPAAPKPLRAAPVALDSLDETGVWEGAFDYHLIVHDAFVFDMTNFTIISNTTDQSTGANTVVLAYDKLTVNGIYFENATLLYILPIFGDGAFTIDGLDARATAVRANATSPYTVTLWIREYVATLENFVGGGLMESLTQGLQPVFGANIYNHLQANVERLIGSMLDTASRIVPDMRSLIETAMKEVPIPKGLMKETGNANAFMDEILARVRELILAYNLEPYTIAETEFLGIYIQGFLYGLSTLHRAGDATFIYEQGIYTLQSTLGIYDMTAEVTWWTEILFITYDGDASLSLEVFELAFQAHAQIRDETQDFLTLDSLIITVTDGVNIEVHVLPGLNWIIETVATPIVKFFDGLLTSIVETILTSIVEEALAAIPIPGS